MSALLAEYSLGFAGIPSEPEAHPEPLVVTCDDDFPRKGRVGEVCYYTDSLDEGWASRNENP